MNINLSVYIEIEGKDVYVGNLSGTNTEDTVFTYAREYLDYNDSRPISISLPLTDQSFDATKTRTYFEGLLPEGFTRKCVAANLQTDEKDYISILSALGSECLGAIKILSEETIADKAAYEQLTQEEVKILAQEGATESAQLVTKAHLSLTGASGKAGLYYDEKQKQWYLPIGTAPSTHIVKQSHIRLKKIVANEQLCLLTARNLGIDVPESFIVKTDTSNIESALFATKRFDRIIGDSNRKLDGLIVPYRLHQEDFSQALGIPASDKYEKNQAGYLKKMFVLLRNYSENPIADQLKLWDILIFNYLVGNTDNHIKNLSLLYSKDLKSVRLASAYDMISTMIYQNSTENLSLAIGGFYRITDIRRESFMMEAKNVGLGTNIAMKHFDDMVSHFESSIEAAVNQLEAESGFCVSDMKEQILLRGGIANYLG